MIYWYFPLFSYSTISFPETETLVDATGGLFYEDQCVKKGNDITSRAFLSIKFMMIPPWKCILGRGTKTYIVCDSDRGSDLSYPCTLSLEHYRVVNILPGIILWDEMNWFLYCTRNITRYIVVLYHCLSNLDVFLWRSEESIVSSVAPAQWAQNQVQRWINIANQFSMLIQCPVPAWSIDIIR